MIESVCRRLKEEMSELYIRQIIKGDAYFFIYLSDQYGNDIDMVPRGFEVETGAEIDVDWEFDISGAYYRVPQEYQTWKEMVMRRLDAEIPGYVYEGLGEYGLYFPMNALYTGYISELQLGQLYAVSNYLTQIFSTACDESEKEDFSAMCANPIVREFLASSLNDKIQNSEDYYYIPKYMEDMVKKSEELLAFVTATQNETPIDEASYLTVKTEVAEAIETCKESLATEQDVFCCVDKMQEKLANISEAVEKECAFCEGNASAISSRMKKQAEVPAFEGFAKKFTAMPSFLKGRKQFGEKE